MLIKALDVAENSRLKEFLSEVKKQVDALLDAWLPQSEHEEKRVHDCMRYAVFAGGKRLRPALVMASYQACGGTYPARAVAVGTAMEMIHTYSLMQDDMPCMDNDDMRRGRPTSHKKFDETTAMLASDGLQTGAYELLADDCVHPDPAVRLELVRLFAQSSGALGMVAGQMIDMEWEWHHPREMGVEKLARMNRFKTGMNIEACCEAGAVLAGADEHTRETLRAYGAALGRSYQVYDDVLDVVGTAEKLGKTPGKDARDGKTTFVSLLGVEGARQLAYAQAAEALERVEPWGARASLLQVIARFCVTREN